MTKYELLVLNKVLEKVNELTEQLEVAHNSDKALHLRLDEQGREIAYWQKSTTNTYNDYKDLYKSFKELEKKTAKLLNKQAKETK